MTGPIALAPLTQTFENLSNQLTYISQNRNEALNLVTTNKSEIQLLHKATEDLALKLEEQLDINRGKKIQIRGLPENQEEGDMVQLLVDWRLTLNINNISTP